MGARRSASATGRGGIRSGLRPAHQRARDRDRDLRPRQLIVPNSNLVSGVVKNWVHNDRVGRIIISVNVTYESDVDQVRDLMIAAAKAQEQVLAIPGPSVLFAEFGDWAMKFNLICFVDDIEQAERTRSEINFEVLRRMREAGLRIAYPAPPPAGVPSRLSRRRSRRRPFRCCGSRSHAPKPRPEEREAGALGVACLALGRADPPYLSSR